MACSCAQQSCSDGSEPAAQAAHHSTHQLRPPPLPGHSSLRQRPCLLDDDCVALKQQDTPGKRELWCPQGPGQPCITAERIIALSERLLTVYDLEL